MRSLTALLLAFCLGLFAVTASAEGPAPEDVECTCYLSPLQGGCICDGRDKWGKNPVRECSGWEVPAGCTCGNGDLECQCDVGGTPCRCGEATNDGLGGVPKEVLQEQNAAWEETEHPGWLDAYANWIKGGGTSAEWRDLTPDMRKRRADVALGTPEPSPPAPLAPYERARGDAYIGVFVVYAEPKTIGGEAGYSHAYKQGVELDHWLPAEQFERTFFKIADDGTSVINEDTVDRFILDISDELLGDRTIAATARTATGFHTTKLANAAQTYAFEPDEATRIANARVRAVVWEHLGFILQWAECGIRGEN